MLKSGSRPAACQVEPAVSSVRSSSTTSDQPFLRQVVERADADDAAADHDHSRMRFHASEPPPAARARQCSRREARPLYGGHQTSATMRQRRYTGHPGDRRRRCGCPPTRRRQKTRYAFLTLPNYSLIAVTNAVEPLRMANRVVGPGRLRMVHRRASTASPSRRAAASTLTPTIAARQGRQGRHPVRLRRHQRSRGRLASRCSRRCAGLRNGALPLGALCTGGYALARAGLLDNYRATIHWENLSALREEFPRVRSERPAVQHRPRSLHVLRRHAPLDLMLNLIQVKHGLQDFAAGFRAVRRSSACASSDDRQYVPLRAQVGDSHRSMIAGRRS